MDTIIYQPNPGRATMRKAFGGIFMAFGGTLGCIFIGAGLVILPLMLSQSDGAEAPTWLFGLMFPCGGLLFLVVFIAVGALLFRGFGPEQITLSHDTLSYTRGKTTTTLHLNEISQLHSKWQMGHRHGHWLVVISDLFGQTLELDIPQGAYLASFDVLPILRDLLPRLPDTVEIEPRVQDYIETGRMKH